MDYELEICQVGGMTKTIQARWPVPSKGALIGRGVECDVKLDDDTCVVSRRHAELRISQEDELVWFQLGGNPSLVNGQPVCSDQSIRLRPGDRVEVAAYVISVIKQDSQLPWMGGPPSFLVETPAGVSDAVCDQDVEDDLATLLCEEGNGARSIDDLLDEPLGEVEVEIDDNWSDMLHEVVDRPSGLIDKSPGCTKAFQEYRDIHSGRQLVNSDSRVDEQDQFLLDFAKGLGFGGDPSVLCNHAYEFGLALKHATDGTLRLLNDRAIFKRETRADQTLIVQRNNNPLKNCPSASEAIRRMLLGTESGYVSASEAFDSAFRDLSGFQRGFVDALQTSLENLRQVLAPEVIGGKASRDAGFLGLRRNHAFKLAYIDLYESLFEQSQDVFESVFGGSFRKAFSVSPSNENKADQL